jgi:hypothetical protein
VVSRALLLLLLLSCVGLGGCDGCGCDRKSEPRPSARRVPTEQCTTAADCADDNPCTHDEACEDGRCVASFVPAGTSCDDDDDVCNGVSTCDGQGRCAPGTPPIIDDGNPCTTDSCDPKKGAIHEPVPIDDGDECTRDACDPISGRITHDPVPIDDGDDCTFDSCDPREGVKHQKPAAFYTCEASCGPGFHASSRAPHAQCGVRGLQTYCSPACGNAFHSCNASCPPGYHAASRATNAQCGGRDTPQSFCQKSVGSSFYTCDERCPDGYRAQSSGPSGQCGSSTATRTLCLAL